MQAYKDFRPTQFDARGLGDIPGNSMVPEIMQTRDSDPLELSNFAAFGRIMDEAGVDYEIHRFGHWGPGWFEIYIVTPSEEAERIIEETEGALSDYPILDEEDFSAREYEEACETWAKCYSIKERIALIQEYGDGNIFAARRDELPEDPTGAIMERLTHN